MTATALPNAPHTRSCHELAAEMDVDLRHGLDAGEAATRSSIFGLNLIEGAGKTSFLKKFLA